MSASSCSNLNEASNLKHTLLLRLVGPMQSWGFRSRFDNRDTALEPTRSGVIGLFSAALGIGRDEAAQLRQFDHLKMGVRVDAPGHVMVDYHTVQRVAKAGGGIADTVQSWRYYLADARFLVGLESGDLDFLRKLEAALKNPKWPLFLGRKSFVPSLPVHLITKDRKTGVREGRDVTTALQEEPWLQVREREKKPTALRLMIETLDAAAGPVMGDVPLDFKARRFGLRYVESIALKDFKDEKELLCFTSHS